jgi:formylmethanofuran dehydrogenase subunit E
MILPDGTEVTDLSVKNLKKYMVDMDLSNWNFVIIRKSTGDEFEVQVKEGVHPESFFELREKVKVEETATPEEIDEFRGKWEETRDKFLTSPDWELFEGVEEPEEPFPVGGAIFFSILVIGLGLLLVLSLRGKAR